MLDSVRREIAIMKKIAHRNCVRCILFSPIKLLLHSDLSFTVRYNSILSVVIRPPVRSLNTTVRIGPPLSRRLYEVIDDPTSDKIYLRSFLTTL